MEKSSPVVAVVIVCKVQEQSILILKKRTYFGSGGPSARGFMESLHRERNTRKASFCRM